jgi:Arylsulfotransferase (ASST)
MSSRFTRRRFLTVLGAGAACLAVTGSAGLALLGRVTKVSPMHTPRDGSLHAPKVLPLPDASLANPEGPWTFRSRPDLSPPVVEVKREAHDDTASGYIFVSPQDDFTGQGGSLTVDDEGRVVWFRPLSDTSVRAMNFGVQTYRGEPVLTWGETPGVYVIFDSSYREIARFGAANGFNGDHHEFLISPQNTALITIYDAVPKDLSSVGGTRDSLAVQGIVQELDIETGELLFEWRSLDHIGIEETYAKPGQDLDYDGIDYFHINSIDVDHDDNLLISARKTSALYKVDRKTGEVIWRLGGKRSDFEMGEGTRFTYQHDARRLPDGTISIFDNGATVFRNGLPKVVEESRVIILDPDERKMMASLVHEYTHPDKMYADAAGNAQVLPNGNVFVGWGRALAISEFSREGELLFDARLPPGNRTYRAFRFEWSANPSARPAVAADRIRDEEVEIFASWNGGTEVETWAVLTGERPDQLEPLGAVPRDGFETAMVAHTPDRYLAVQARDRFGRTLGTSKPVIT